MTAAAVRQPSSPPHPPHPRRRRAWWLVAGLVLAAACAAALLVAASPPGGAPWIVWARPAAVQWPAQNECTLYDSDDVRLTPGGVRDELGWTPGGARSGSASTDLAPALWRNEQGGRIRRLVDELLRRGRGTPRYISIGVQRAAGGDPSRWDAFVLEGPFREEIRAASADPGCVGAWDVTDANGGVVRWTLAADGIVTGPAGGGGWGVRDGVLAMWAAPTTQSPMHAAGLLADDGASFVGHTGGQILFTAAHGVRVSQ